MRLSAGCNGQRRPPISARPAALQQSQWSTALAPRSGAQQLSCLRKQLLWQRSGRLHPRSMRVCCVHTEHEGSGEQQQYSIDPQRLLQRLYEPLRIGAEYGEGFVQFKIRGEALHLDVDTLNEKLRTSGATRMRHAMKPDEAFGMIFNWDGVIMDTRRLQRRAWKLLAAELKLPFPQIERQLYDIRPERAITEVLQWTHDWAHAQQLSLRFGELLVHELEVVRTPLPGATEWLHALHSSNVPCAVVTSLDRMDMRRCLERMGLQRYFRADVTAEDGMETLSQRFLSAALKLGRPPDSCVVFDSCPAGVTAAHNCTMKAVAVRTLHRGYHLTAADLTCSSMNDLSVYNMRRLFAMRGSEFMDHQHRQQPGQHGRGGRGRLLRNATIDPPERPVG